VCFSVFAEERKFGANNPFNANSFQKNNLAAGAIQIKSVAIDARMVHNWSLSFLYVVSIFVSLQKTSGFDIVVGDLAIGRIGSAFSGPLA
jgi:hypothetical protein